MMKKLMALVIVVMVALTGIVCAAGAEETFTFRNGIHFGMNMDQVIAAETARYHEIDNEHTHGHVTFGELEYEHVTENGARADLKYLFVGNELVAIRVNYEDRAISYNQLLADLTAQFGAAGPVDTQKLGNGIFAADDDGWLEGRAEAIESGDMMIILERDDDDIDVTFIDLTAAYIR